MRRSLQLFTLLILSITATRAAAALLPPVTIAYGHTNPANGHDYYMLRGADPFEGISWDDAEAVAVGLGGHLLSINDAAENTWVLNNFPGGASGYLDYYVWIGLNDKAQEGKFVWSSGEPVTFTRWYSGEPNNYRGNEDFALIYNFSNGNFRWNDSVGNAIYDDGYPISAIAEIAPAAVPEPSTAGLGTLLAGVMVICQRAPRHHIRLLG